MKKSNLAAILAACMLSLVFAGCAEEEITSSSEEATVTSEASVNETVGEQEEDVTESASEDQGSDDMAAVNATSADGFGAGETVPESELENGIWEAIMASSNEDQAGLPDEKGRVQAIIYEASFEGDTIKATGVFTQRDPKVLFSAIAASDNTTHEFKVDDSTVYQQFESDGPVPIAKEECANYLDTLLDCGCVFEVEMENGVVKAVSFYS